MDVVSTAERLAEDVLLPAALTTDRTDTVAVDLLDALGGAGLYGLSGPAAAGGLEAGFETVCAVVERLASGCLTTTFVWAQHLGAVLAAATSGNDAICDWLSSLCSGERRAGLALGGALLGPAKLVAREKADGWDFSGTGRETCVGICRRA